MIDGTMKTAIAMACIFLLLHMTAASQFYYFKNQQQDSKVHVELGFSGGTMHSLTDIGGNKGDGKGFIKDLNLNHTHKQFGMYASATITYLLGVRLEANFGKVSGHDSVMKNVKETALGRYQRNLGFASTISELALVAELHPLFFKQYDENESPYFSPYILAGVGVFHFNPYTEIDGHRKYLQPLHTEGQGFAEYPKRKNYSLTQLNIPIGIGLKYELNDWLNLRFEVVHRILFTDYLDDVSTNYIDASLFSKYLSPMQVTDAGRLHARRQEIEPLKPIKVGEIRGNPKNNDAYFTTQLRLGINLSRLQK